MAHLESLLNDLANLDAEHDLEGMRRVREQIATEFPESDAAVEANYRLGLDLLFSSRNIAGAVEKFEIAGNAKQPFWSAAARTSLGLCHYHQNRLQKALFELRKVAYSPEPNVHSVTALTFIEGIFEAEGKPDEARRVRKDRIAQLEQLVTKAREQGRPQEHGYHIYCLGLALLDHGEERRARAVLEEAKAMGPGALGVDLHRAVAEALRS